MWQAESLPQIDYGFTAQPASAQASLGRWLQARTAAAGATFKQCLSASNCANFGQILVVIG